MEIADLIKIIQEAIHTKSKQYTQTRFKDPKTLFVQINNDQYLITVQRL